jgi:MOSC domain-containing protein YiiM
MDMSVSTEERAAFPAIPDAGTAKTATVVPHAGDRGTVLSVNISEKKGTRKTPVPSGAITLDGDFGVHGDAHAGDWHRQVSFLAEESIDIARGQGLDVGNGDFGENITTKGIDMKSLPLGTRLAVGSAIVEVSQIGKICHRKCAIYYRAGDCIFPREGVFGWVVEPGEVHVGDPIEVLEIGKGDVHRRVSDNPL